MSAGQLQQREPIQCSHSLWISGHPSIYIPLTCSSQTGSEFPATPPCSRRPALLSAANCSPFSAHEPLSAPDAASLHVLHTNVYHSYCLYITCTHNILKLRLAHGIPSRFSAAVNSCLILFLSAFLLTSSGFLSTTGWGLGSCGGVEAPKTTHTH